MRYGIFLRGINTGARRISSQQLEALLQKAGFAGKAVLATGNLVLTAKVPAEMVLQKVLREIGTYFQSEQTGVIRTETELADLLATLPMETAGFNQMVLFTDVPLYEALFDEADSPPLQPLTGHDLLWTVAKGKTTEGFGRILTKKKYQALLTSRNRRTVEKVLKQMQID